MLHISSNATFRWCLAFTYNFYSSISMNSTSFLRDLQHNKKNKHSNTTTIIHSTKIKRQALKTQAVIRYSISRTWINLYINVQDWPENYFNEHTIHQVVLKSNKYENKGYFEKCKNDGVLYNHQYVIQETCEQSNGQWQWHSVQ